MPPVGFEPTISAGERPQTHALDRAANGTGRMKFTFIIISKNRVTFGGGCRGGWGGGGVSLKQKMFVCDYAL